MSQPRSALISSAVTFLRDPSTSSSPLAQRIAFLESKGLTPPEIEHALAAASNNAAGPVGGRNWRGPAGRGGGSMEFERDWRDWFIMGVVGGTVGWVVVKLAKKYLVPHLQPPTSTDLIASQQALEAKYDEAAALLAQLQLSTDTLTTTIDEQKEVVDAELVEVRKAVEEMREGEKKRNQWAQDVEKKVEELTRGLPVMLEKQATTTAQSLTDLQTELKSLKSLLIARRPTPFTSSPASSYSSTSTFTPRAQGIPSWQLNGSSTALASSSTPISGSAMGSASGSGSVEKAKETPAAVEEDTSASGVLVQKEAEASGSGSAAGSSVE